MISGLETSTYAVAQAIAAELDAIEQVVRRHGGARGEVATYGGQKPVDGVRVAIKDGVVRKVRVDIVVAYGDPIPAIAEQVRQAALAAVEYHSGMSFAPAVDVNVCDVELPSRIGR